MKTLKPLAHSAVVAAVWLGGGWRVFGPVMGPPYQPLVGTPTMIGPWTSGPVPLRTQVVPGVAIIRSSTGAPGLERITCANGLFLAVGGGVTATSQDGFHWAVHTVTNNAIVGWIKGVAAGTNNFAAVGNLGTNGVVQLSPDGVVWSQPVMLPSVQLGGVAYANGTYVAVGQSGGVSAVVTSSDGVHWNTRTFAGSGPLRAVTTGGGAFVAVGDAGTILTSANGLDWLTQVVPRTNISSVAYGNGLFVANEPYFGYGLTSTNGTNWVVTPPSGRPSSAPQWYSVAYGNGLFVGIDPNVDVSTNGVDWTTIWLHPRAEIYLTGVAYGAGTFDILVDGGGLFNVSPRAFLGWNAGTNGLLDLTLTGGWAGQSCRLQAATNLPASNWVDLLTFTNQGSVTPLHDPGATNYPRRFYRVAMP